MSAYSNSNGPHAARDFADAYSIDDGADARSMESIPYSKENIPIGHLSSHLEELSTGDVPGPRTAPPTPGAPYYVNTPQMRAMSDTSLFIPETASADGGVSDEMPLIARPQAAAGTGWEERGAAKIVRTHTDAHGNVVTSIIKKSVKDFKFDKSLGEGSYSTVVLAIDRTTGKNYAIKVLDKRHIIREKKVKYVNIEKNTLNRLGKRDGIITMHFTFQDEASLYFVLDYAPNGELLSLIKKHGTMNEESVRYYCAQVLDGIKYMHDNGVVHRDIKPENILIDHRMRAQITDFGTAKLLEKDASGRYPADVRAVSFVGTAEYVSPELLNDKCCGKPCDIWAFGCIMYQMIAGKPPFKATNEYLTFQKVCKLQYAFTAGFPLIVRDLIKKILVLNPAARASVKAIQGHYFFADVDWTDHDAIFGPDPPELGPYKVTAKSMMPVPELSQQSLSRPRPKRAAAAAAQGSSTSLGLDESPRVEQGAFSAPSTPSAAPSAAMPGKRPIKSASSAAAAALAKSTNASASADSSADSDATPPPPPPPAQAAPAAPAPAPSNGPRKAPEHDLYIPGTKILRPVVKSRVVTAPPSSSSSSSGKPAGGSRTASSSRKKNASKAIVVTPMTPVDIAWAAYLKHPNERVVKVGHVLVSQTTTDQFEKKYKGMLAESPLGYTNGRRSSNASSSSLLSQIASGQHPGLRRGNSANLLGYISTITEQESDTAFVYNAHEDDEPGAEKEKPEMGKFKKVWKGLGPSSGSGGASGELSSAKDRTMLITSFGRAMLFKLTGNRYELRTEIDLTNPAVKFKEIVGDKRVKNLITNGVFAIESLKITLMFEVEKQDILLWTTALVKAKDNEEERVAREAIEAELGSANNASSALTAAAIASLGSPKQDARSGFDGDIADLQLNAADVTEQIRGYDMKTLSKLVQSRSPRASMDDRRAKESNGNGSHDHHHHHHQVKLMDSKLKRKPPPKKAAARVPDSHVHNDGNLISAAVNTAIHNSDIRPTSNNRSSSFSRGGGVSSYFLTPHQEPRPATPSQRAPSNGSGSSGTKNGQSTSKNMITSLNSKFLARSHRGKK